MCIRDSLQGMSVLALDDRELSTVLAALRDHQRSHCPAAVSYTHLDVYKRQSYDIAFRFQQALDPSALITLPTALHALNAAIADCRNAGRPHESDPAVILLARHLGDIASHIERPNVELRRACMDAIADLRRKPALIALAHKGVAYDLSLIHI